MHPKSHLRFAEFAPPLEIINETGVEIRKNRNTFLDDFFTKSPDESGEPYCKKHITAPKGSLILWDSRTIHWNQHADKNRASSDNPKVRMVGYFCYVPKARLTDENKLLRQEAFQKGISTGHNPSHPQLKYTNLYKEFEQYLESFNYSPPVINLTPLGESLLGIQL